MRGKQSLPAQMLALISIPPHKHPSGSTQAVLCKVARVQPLKVPGWWESVQTLYHSPCLSHDWSSSPTCYKVKQRSGLLQHGGEEGGWRNGTVAASTSLGFLKEPAELWVAIWQPLRNDVWSAYMIPTSWYNYSSATIWPYCIKLKTKQSFPTLSVYCLLLLLLLATGLPEMYTVFQTQPPYRFIMALWQWLASFQFLP